MALLTDHGLSRVLASAPASAAPVLVLVPRGTTPPPSLLDTVTSITNMGYNAALKRQAPVDYLAQHTYDSVKCDMPF